jgi:hypothetical protein
MIEQMSKRFKKDIMNEQQSLIDSLQQLIKELELENKELKKDNLPQIYDLKEKDEELIAKVQIVKLKSVAFDRELTFEETRKLEIFTKILNITSKDNKNIIEMEAKTISSEELKKMLGTDETH